MFSNTAAFFLRILDLDGKEVGAVKKLKTEAFQREVHDKIDKKSITGPFVPFDDERRWFYPAGTMKLKNEADGKVYFLQNGEKVFEVKGSEIKLKIDPSKGKLIFKVTLMH